MPHHVANEDFLRACFGTGAEAAHVTGFEEDPAELENLGLRHCWTGTKWSHFTSAARAALPVQNSYVTISLFNDDPADGRARRRKLLFRATHVIVLDDVGTKVAAQDVLAKMPTPSWSLETSPGNHQWGYILDVPETDAGRVNALLDGMVASGLCPDGKDPGMRGVTRYVRLPQGRNTKAKYGAGGFTCRMVDWEPGRRFTIAELAAPWGIALPAPGTVSGTPGKSTANTAAGEDRLFEWLNGWGMIDGTRAADGVGFTCECPWLDEHTGRADSGAAYWPGGGFTCFHGHCAGKGRADLVPWIDERLRKEGRPGLATVDFKDADRPQIDRFWRILAARRALRRQEVSELASVPNRGDVDAMLRAARDILGTNIIAIRAAMARARKRHTAEAHRRFRAAGSRGNTGNVVPLPADWAAPVPLAEAQASMERVLRDHFSDADKARPAGNAPLRIGRRRAA